MYHSVARIIPAQHVMEGAGFPVRRPFPTRDLDAVDPFLLLDEMGPVDWGPGQAVGAPDHPHRGFETVTYVLDGHIEHRDSQGNRGRLGPGDVQWMTAGAGVVHSEQPDSGFRRAGGRLHAFQLWVNLPRALKMTRPRYQGVGSAEVPVVIGDDGRAVVRVIAGEVAGLRAAVETQSPILYLHVTLQPAGVLEQPVPRGFGVCAYVVRGCVDVGLPADSGGRAGIPERQLVSNGHLVLFAFDGERVRMAAPGEASFPVEVLLLAGRPLDEPVARHGPFVMNTDEELREAFEDYRLGRMGRIEG